MFDELTETTTAGRKHAGARLRRPARPWATMATIGLALIAVACGGSDDGVETSAAETEPTAEVVATSPPAPTAEPTAVPTEVPTEAPTEVPTEVPAEVADEPAETTDASAATDTDSLDAGGELYAANCARCHGDDGGGTNRGKPLLGIATNNPDPEHQMGIVTNGKGRMPAFAESLSDEEIDAVVSYIRATF